MLICTSCGSEYYLKRSKINLYKAIARGAKVDSSKFIVRDTVKLTGLSDIKFIEKIIKDTVFLKELCPKVKTAIQKKALQKLVCPDVLVDTLYTLYANVDGKKYPVKIHFVGSSIAGQAGYKIEVSDLKIPYIKTEIRTDIKPGSDSIKWYHLLSVGLLCLIFGVIIGKVF